MMKKFKYIILPLFAVSAAVTLSACSGKPVNQGPELRGVNNITCLANTEVDLLEGVAALDLEDGDITPNLKITVTPEVAVENGYAVFPEAGEYEVCYEVYDSLGKLARTTVEASVTEREVYMGNILTNGFSLKTEGGAKALKNGLNGSAYSFNVTGQEIAEDVRLTRTYALITGVEYTFKYYYECNLSGRIKIAANGAVIAEANVNAGGGEIQFTYTAESADASENAEIELWLGGLEGDLQFSVSKAETQRYQAGDSLTEKLENFSFDGKIFDRFDGTEGNVGTVDGGKGVFVEITKASADTWRGGVFVNTGLAIGAGSTYTVSYDAEAENGGAFEVILQNKQWDEAKINVSTAAGHNQFDFTVTEQTAGTLWIYIASGANVNKITLKNLSVKAHEGGNITESFSVGQIYSNNFGGGEGSARCEYGKLIYDIKTFGSDWGQNELGTPAFALSGAAGNFVITFRAKASSPVNCVFAASVADYWDTFAWKQLKFTAQEQTYSVRCDDKSVEGSYKFLWQFGSAANSNYSDVKIEISDIKICYLSELEG